MNKKGFAIFEVILFVIIILVVAAGIWYYETHTGTPAQPASRTTPGNDTAIIMLQRLPSPPTPPPLP